MAGDLSPGSAESLADAICSALGIDDADTKSKYASVYKLVYAALKADITITIASMSINTSGSPAAQSGPPADIDINPK